jgi:hypothetical protein
MAIGPAIQIRDSSYIILLDVVGAGHSSGEWLMVGAKSWRPCNQGGEWLVPG